MHVLADSVVASVGYGAVWLAVVAAYWSPSIVAAARHVPNMGSVIVVNLFLGWTVIGWIVAMAMAARSRPPSGQPPRHAPQQPPTMRGYR